ncbi:MAG TPA: glycosyltransferase [Gemmatimonadales bacterium]|nr:glycosyltransferase [Gemmatimonadales bacterium]
MHVALFARDRLPVRKYGGTQRIIVYLARGLAEAGHRVTLLASAGSDVAGATLVPLMPVQLRRPDLDLRPLLPAGVDVLLTFVPLAHPPDVPWIRSLHGNRPPGTIGLPNTLYLSRDHAERHGSSAFVYNGIDLSEFTFRPVKSAYDLFLGRLHGVKGYRWAIEGARLAKRRLIVAGGWRPSLRRSVRFVGKVGGQRKAELLADAACLWMPALWDEPFGLTLVEALASGTPVLGTRRGALPEIVTPEVGALRDTLDQLVAARTSIERIDAEACRARVERHYTHHVMAAEYVRMFREYLATGALPAGRVVQTT